MYDKNAKYIYLVSTDVVGSIHKKINVCWTQLPGLIAVCKSTKSACNVFQHLQVLPKPYHKY